MMSQSLRRAAGFAISSVSQEISGDGGDAKMRRSRSLGSLEKDSQEKSWRLSRIQL